VLLARAAVNDATDFDSLRLNRLLALPKVSKYSRLSMVPTSTGRPRLSGYYDAPTIRSFARGGPVVDSGKGRSIASTRSSTVQHLRKSSGYGASYSYVTQTVAERDSHPPAPARGESLPFVRAHQLARRTTSQAPGVPPSRHPVDPPGDARHRLSPGGSSAEAGPDRPIRRVSPVASIAPPARDPQADQPGSLHAFTEYADPSAVNRTTEGSAGSEMLQPPLITRNINHQNSLTATHSNAASDGRTPSQTGAATVHLDGSALGRWAIQHLERSLSKPANGMTGVDPRASAPRGRVSPF
jgi:hypothetical protein